MRACAKKFRHTHKNAGMCEEISPYPQNAGMAKLADAQDLGSCIARCAGSSPVARTKGSHRGAFFGAGNSPRPAPSFAVSRQCREMLTESASKGNNGGNICAAFTARRTPFVQSSSPVPKAPIGEPFLVRGTVRDLHLPLRFRVSEMPMKSASKGNNGGNICAAFTA